MLIGGGAVPPTACQIPVATLQIQQASWHLRRDIDKNANLTPLSAAKQKRRALRSKAMGRLD